MNIKYNVIKSKDSSVEEVKDQMQQTQEAIIDMLSPTEFKTPEENVVNTLTDEAKEVEIEDVVKPKKTDGRNTLIWKPLSIIKYAQMDLPYEVSIFNARLKGSDKPHKFEYTVNIIQR